MNELEEAMLWWRPGAGRAGNELVQAYYTRMSWFAETGRLAEAIEAGEAFLAILDKARTPSPDLAESARRRIARWRQEIAGND